MILHRASSFIYTLFVSIALLGWCVSTVAVYASEPTGPGEPYPFALPDTEGPVVVSARFELRDINEINDEAETFEFTSVLTLSWQDSRQAFNPANEGVTEKIYTGAYQFNEIAPGWYPQVVLVNEAGALEKNGVVLRVQPDGTSILIETMNAVAEAEFNMTRYPFDQQRLEAIFEVLGFKEHDVQLKIESDSVSTTYGAVKIPQWHVIDAAASVRETIDPNGDNGMTKSTLVVSIDLQRKPFFILRLVVLPLTVIVLLSFSVFWMERSSLGDRIGVSFIGILTAVSYQIVMGDSMPRIAYFTLIHSFMYFSFLTMCATVVINLVVGSLDKKKQFLFGDLIDRRCRWIFPLAYFSVLLAILGIAFIFY